MPEETRTAEPAARAAGCALDQIVKSIRFWGKTTGALRLFLTAGCNRVSPAKASALEGEALGRADADQVRAETGFAIGGVAPLGHRKPLPAWLHPRLLDFPTIWAAAGTPNHIFEADPRALLRATAARVADFVEPAPRA
jgi:prolyl-tRNA editing enzyme YbaK/EbsC (Cys-tRNA(Pro) deacylase)